MNQPAGGERDVELVMAVMARATAAAREGGFRLEDPEHRSTIARHLVQKIIAGERNENALMNAAMAEILKLAGK